MIVDLEVRAAAKIDPMAAAIGRRDIAVALARLLGIELDGAADGVPAGQRALWTAKNFDPVKIQKVKDRTGQRGVVDVVDIQTDARLERGVEVVLANATDRSGQRVTECRTLRLQRDARRLHRNLVDAGFATSIHHRRVDGSDGDRCVLQVLSAELGRHRDLGKRRGRGFRGTGRVARCRVLGNVGRQGSLTSQQNRRNRDTARLPEQSCPPLLRITRL